MNRKVARGLGLSGGFDATESNQPEAEPSVQANTRSSKTTPNSANEPTGAGAQEKPVATTPSTVSSISRTQTATDKASRRVGVSSKYDGAVIKTSIVLPEAVHDALVEISFHNRKTSKETLNDLFLQGIDKVLHQHGLGTIDKVVQKAEKVQSREV